MASLRLLCTVGGDLASPRTEAKSTFFFEGGGSWSCTLLYLDNHLIINSNNLDLGFHIYSITTIKVI